MLKPREFCNRNFHQDCRLDQSLSRWASKRRICFQRIQDSLQRQSGSIAVRFGPRYLERPRQWDRHGRLEVGSAVGRSPCGSRRHPRSESVSPVNRLAGQSRHNRYRQQQQQYSGHRSANRRRNLSIRPVVSRRQTQIR